MLSHARNDSIIHDIHVNFNFNPDYSFSLIVSIKSRTFTIVYADELVMRALANSWFPET